MYLYAFSCVSVACYDTRRVTWRQPRLSILFCRRTVLRLYYFIYISLTILLTILNRKIVTAEALDNQKPRLHAYVYRCACVHVHAADAAAGPSPCASPLPPSPTHTHTSTFSLLVHCIYYRILWDNYKIWKFSKHSSTDISLVINKRFSLVV